MTEARPDTAGVIAPPPLIALAAVLIGLALDRLFPIGVVGAVVPHTPRLLLAGLFFLAGAGIGVRALLNFRAHGTPAEPWRPTTALVTTGIFAKTRNPIYQGFGLVLAACVFGFGSDWTLVCGVIAAAVLHFGVVRREERYLTQKFGEPYRAYCARVPRYGWPF